MPLDPSKIFMYPESYNQLRKELCHPFHARLWKKVQWFMAFDFPLFVENMNRELDLRVYFEADLDGVCTIYLNELRKKRGPDAIIH